MRKGAKSYKNVEHTVSESSALWQMVRSVSREMKAVQVGNR